MVEHHLAKVRVAGSNPVVRSRSVVLPLVGVLVAVAAVLASCANTESTEPDVYVAAASDTRDAFTELAAELKASDQIKVEFVFGSSGMLREQVLNGAPYDVYVSANTAFVAEIVDAGFVDAGNVRQYALGALAMIAREGVTLPSAASGGTQPADRSSIVAALGSAARIVIANPAHAPYGVAAKEFLESLKTYGDISERLIFAENVADAVRIVESREADYGIVALALVRDRTHLVINGELHQPIRQTAALTKRGEGNQAARAFFDALVSSEGIALLEKYGFVVEADS